MYQLNSPLSSVHGIGDKLSEQLGKKNLHSVLDLLLHLPLRYEDRSQIIPINQLNKQSEIVGQSSNIRVKQQFSTIRARVGEFRQYRKGRLLISRAKAIDNTGEVGLIWFNNKFIKNKLTDADVDYFISGEYKNGSLVQAGVELVGADNLHTARLVPIYSKIGRIKQGNLRRLQKEIIDHLSDRLSEQEKLFGALHFPEQIEAIIEAREKLALEELLYLIAKSKKLKAQWQEQNQAQAIKIPTPIIPDSIPFTLTAAQERATREICQDLKDQTAMNRLLVGDVGSGKTIVAGIAAHHVCQEGESACLVAPTQILAQQHFQTLTKIFPNLKIQLLTAANKKDFSIEAATFYIGTHAVINQLKKINPALVIYDEQHRFGTKQRLSEQAHVLTMTATPIPRSLMLTIFSHLELSILDELPNNRQMAETWLVPKKKEVAGIEWLAKQLLADPKKQALIVCPFIDPSRHQALENVAAVKDSLEKIQQQLKTIDPDQKIQVASLHSRLSKKAQQQVIADLYAGDTQLLITTPMVEVGVDLPNADFIIIQAAERFGLASLHQLRGRVGRAGQESFCLLFTSQEKISDNGRHRLEVFCEEKNGFKLAEQDLENRGAGDIFGTAQSGFGKLHFASWTNAELIKKAQTQSENQTNSSWLEPYFDKRNLSQNINNN